MNVLVVKRFYGIREGRDFEEGSTVDMTEERYEEVRSKLPDHVKPAPAKKPAGRSRAKKPAAKE